MVDYEKIAVLIVRGFAVSFFFTGVYEIVFMLLSKVLQDAMFIPQGTVDYQSRILASVIYVILAAILAKWSRSLARFIADGVKREDRRVDHDGD